MKPTNTDKPSLSGTFPAPGIVVHERRKDQWYTVTYQAGKEISCEPFTGGEDPLRLFHATKETNLSVLEPRLSKALNGESGQFVFATNDLSKSFVYALKTPDMVCMHYMPGFPDRSIHACIIKDREKFLCQNHSGTIYELPTASFRRLHFENEVPSSEWVSSVPVKTSREKIINVTFEDAIRRGIQVFFASPDADEDLIEDVYDPEIKPWEESGYYRAWRRGDLKWENYDRGISPFAEQKKISVYQTMNPLTLK